MSNGDFFPVGGIDYPQALQGFDEWFSAEEACIDYLNGLRWPNETGLIRCGSLSSCGFRRCGT